MTETPATPKKSRRGAGKPVQRCMTGPKVMEIAIRRAEVLRLRIRGKTIPQICALLSLSPKVVHGDLMAELNAANAQRETDRAHVRTLVGARLDWFVDSLTPRIEKGDTAAIAQARAIESDRAKMYGADEPDLISAPAAGKEEPTGPVMPMFVVMSAEDVARAREATATKERSDMLPAE
jgi:DNA-binding CsgD family transcriptional regulator